MKKKNRLVFNNFTETFVKNAGESMPGLYSSDFGTPLFLAAS